MSSGSESDEDFVPGEPEQVSEEDSANEETDLQFEKEQEQKANKRKASKKETVKKRRRTRNNVYEVEEKDEEVEQKEEELDPEEQKKREDDLWAMFLDGTDTKTKPKTEINEKNTASNSSKISSDTQDTSIVKPKTEDDSKEREKRIFEFAGETIVVENNTIKERIKSTVPPSIESTLSGPSSRSKPGGLSSVLGHINRKNKLSTLEVSKLDWETYKQKEGIEEEVKNFNKGKDGYLERQDFLQRADLRQYEIERDLRMKRRSNR